MMLASFGREKSERCAFGRHRRGRVEIARSSRSSGPNFETPAGRLRANGSPQPLKETLSIPMPNANSPDSQPLVLLQAGFDGLPLVETPSLFWRIGRWLREQGGRRPMSVRVVNEGTAIVDGRVLAIEHFGAVRELSGGRRPRPWEGRAPKTLFTGRGG